VWAEARNPTAELKCDVGPLHIGVIKELPPGPKRAMLERLYIEYQDLCAHAHGRPITRFNKTVFDSRSPLRKVWNIRTKGLFGVLWVGGILVGFACGRGRARQ